MYILTLGISRDFIENIYSETRIAISRPKFTRSYTTTQRDARTSAIAFGGKPLHAVSLVG